MLASPVAYLALAFRPRFVRPAGIGPVVAALVLIRRPVAPVPGAVQDGGA